MRASHRDVVLRSRAWLLQHAPNKLRGLRLRSAAPSEDTPLFPPSYTVAERVVASSGTGAAEQLLVKWAGLGYSCATWEHAATWQRSPADAAVVVRFRAREAAASAAAAAPPKTAAAAAAAAGAVPSDGTAIAPPPFRGGCSLRDYQRVSFDWMARNALARRNVILGDEMGLGKTAQSVAVLEWRACLS